MDYNWALFDGAHVLIRPKGMTVEQLQEGYVYFLREAYSISGIVRRCRAAGTRPHVAAGHLIRNYLLSRYGLSKTRHAIGLRAARRAGPAGSVPEALPPREAARPSGRVEIQPVLVSDETS
jgi:hypothetical protein